MSEPWYQDGLRFTCTRCGHCCTGEPGFVWVEDDGPGGHRRSIAANRSKRSRRCTRAGPAAAGLSAKRATAIASSTTAQQGCTVYAVRPPQCRTWPFWESNVDTPEAWRHTCDVCPGSGQGELISVEEITRRLKLIVL